MAKEPESLATAPQHEAHSPELYEPHETAPSRRESIYRPAEERDDDELRHITLAELQHMMGEPNNLHKEINALITDVNRLRAYRQNYQEQLQDTKQALARHEAMLDRLLTQPQEQPAQDSPAPEATQRSGKLPDLPLFDGTSKNGHTFDNWLVQVKTKLWGNANSYTSEDLKIMYVVGRISGKALTLISPRLDQ